MSHCESEGVREYTFLDLTDEAKHAGNSLMGVVTQCVLLKNVEKCNNSTSLKPVSQNQWENGRNQQHCRSWVQVCSATSWSLCVLVQSCIPL